MKCGNYAETGDTKIQGIGIFCTRTAGHHGLCSAELPGFEHSGNLRREAYIKVQWKAKHKARATS